jgi:hypothetical protein
MTGGDFLGENGEASSACQRFSSKFQTMKVIILWSFDYEYTKLKMTIFQARIVSMMLICGDHHGWGAAEPGAEF